MDVRAIIFDLDDTLYDCTNNLIPQLITNISLYLATKTHFTASEIATVLRDCINKCMTLGTALKKFCDDNYIEDEVREKVKQKIISGSLDIKPFPCVNNLLQTLREQNIKVAIVTSGDVNRQNQKIDSLNIRDKIDHILIHEGGGDKTPSLKKALEILSEPPGVVLCVGDRIDKEIAAGNKLGMVTVRVLTGRHKQRKPTKKNEKPDYTINSICELPKLLRRLDLKDPRVVAIGGGTGLPNMLKGMKTYTSHLTGIVAVTDSGRSTGMLRKNMQIPAMGDLRNCLVALSTSEESIYELFRYRFDKGELKGHSFGNLFIAALTQTKGSFEKAIEETSKILNVQGQVIPSTLENVHLCAELEDGTVLKEENIIVSRNNKNIERSPIKKVFLSDKAPANPKAIKEINEADIIIIGPGQLYTSVISPLLPDGIKQTIAKSNAIKVFICNIMTVAAQTHNYTVEDHLRAVEKVLGEGVIDYVIYSDQKPPKKLLASYEKEKAFLVEYNGEPVSAKAIPCRAIEDLSEKRQIWSKQDWLRHDPDRIAEVIIDLYQQRGFGK